MQLPASLLDQLQALPAFDRAAFTAAHESAPPVSVRRHPQKPWSPPAPVQGGVAWCSDGFYLQHRPLFTADPLFHAGAYYVQEASSMFLQEVLRQLHPSPQDLRVLDLCAAPGGKSTLIASWLDGNGLLLSNEVIRSRASILEENMTRWGYMNTWVCSNDPRDLGRIGGYFDIIVADAPCSGSGLFRKDPAALNEWSPANVQLCSERQQRILADIWPALKQDGYLVYATCSYSQEEDEAVLDALADHFELETIPLQLQEDWGITMVQSPRHGCFGYRFFPDKVQGEGFFIAVVRKTEYASNPATPRQRSQHHKQAAAQAQALLQPGEYAVLEKEKDLFTAIRAAHEADLQLLKSYVYLRRTGILLGMPGPKEWIPEHDLALSLDCGTAVSRVELDRDTALRYLQKEAIELPSGLKGWQLVCYRGAALGWVKALGNRVNNYLPKHWRIRMNLDQHFGEGE